MLKSDGCRRCVAQFTRLRIEGLHGAHCTDFAGSTERCHLEQSITFCLPLLFVSIVGIDVLTPVLETLTGKHAALMLPNSKLRSNPCHVDFAAVC